MTMQRNWNQEAIEQQILCNGLYRDHSEIRREASPISVESLYCSSFNFDDVRNGLDDLSQEVNKEQRQPVQHPSGNEKSSSDYEIQTVPVPALRENTYQCTPLNFGQNDDSYNSINVSYLSSENSYGPNMRDFTNEVDRSQQCTRPLPIHYNSAAYPPRLPLQNNYPMQHPNFRASADVMYPARFNSTLQQQLQFFQQPQYMQQQYSNGYSSVPTNCGLQLSLTNIAAPPKLTPDFKPEITKESVENDSTNSYFSTMPLRSDSYVDNAQSHVNTVSGAVTSTTTRPYVGPSAAATGARNDPIKEKVKVFVTYAQENQIPDHIRTVVQISQTLFKNSIEVAVDMLEETVRAMSVSDWLESSILNSDFVLICVSPSYRQVVDGSCLQNSNAVNTQYIYRRIHAEYISQGSKNFRFIPVLVSGANAEHIPPWLRDTKVFEWPKDYEDIIYRLFRQEKFIKPKPGPPPKHRIERYSNQKDSYDSEKSKSNQTKPKQIG